MLRLVLFILTFGSTAAAGQVRISGVVSDSVDLVPISDATLTLDDSMVVQSDYNGAFSFPAVPSGAHSLTVSALGFRETRFTLTVDRANGTVQDLGLIVLTGLPPVEVLLTGTVFDTVAGSGVHDAEVVLAARTRTRTDDNGEFSTEPVLLQPGHYMAMVRGFGFRPAPFHVTISSPGAIEVEVNLERLPVFLPDIEVWAEGLQRERLNWFYRRAEGIPGRFIHPQEMDSLRLRYVRASDMFAHLPGLSIMPPDNRVVFLRCGTPLLVLNDVPIKGDWTIDDLVGIEQITAVEVYRPAEVPLRFAFTAGCGVIVLWTY